jgi:hypothetical protein
MLTGGASACPPGAPATPAAPIFRGDRAGWAIVGPGVANEDATSATAGTDQLDAHVRWASYVRPMAKPQQARNQTKAARTHQGRARRVDAKEARFPTEYRTV